MITFYTGIPRSGKTLKSVSDIYFEFISDKKTFIDTILSYLGKEEEKEEKYLYLCTNINKFNFDLSDKFYKLDFNQLIKDLTFLHKMYLLHKSDDEIIEKAKEFKLYKVLFVFDECHNFFKSKQDDVLIWWLTYHGHMYHDIILITQDMSLLSKEYKTQGEQFYKAIPQTYRMSKNVFKYSLYSTYGMYQKDYISSTTIKPQKEIFDMYVSGDTVNSKSILHKYIYMFFALLILCIFSFMFVIDSFSNDTDETTNIYEKELNKRNQKDTKDNSSNTNESNDDVVDETYIEEDLSHLKYMLLKCNTKRGFCLYKNQKINTNFYLKMKQLQNFQEIAVTPIFNDFVYLEVFVTDTFYSIYNKDNNNETNNTNNSAMFPTSSPSN